MQFMVTQTVRWRTGGYCKTTVTACCHASSQFHKFTASNIWFIDLMWHQLLWQINVLLSGSASDSQWNLYTYGVVHAGYVPCAVGATCLWEKPLILDSVKILYSRLFPGTLGMRWNGWEFPCFAEGHEGSRTCNHNQGRRACSLLPLLLYLKTWCQLSLSPEEACEIQLNLEENQVSSPWWALTFTWSKLCNVTSCHRPHL